MSTAPSSKLDSSLTNDDLAPTTPAHRTWGTYNYIALWFSMSMEITTYQLASSLIAKGMDWKQAVGTVLLGNLIVLVPMLLNAHAGNSPTNLLPFDRLWVIFRFSPHRKLPNLEAH